MRQSMQSHRRSFRNFSRAVIVAAIPAAIPAAAQAQWVTTHEQFYMEAPHNWQFRQRYAAADRLFNAFDFGHAILYETLWTKPGASPAELEVKWYDRLTKDILVRPPRVPLEEGAIEIRYAQLAPEAKAMFEWAHILHRQMYDVLADERLTERDRDLEVAKLLEYYRSRRDVAFSSRPKSMALMQEQPYSLAFRRSYPKFNGLIWAYHWLQIGLYEPLVVNRSVEGRQAGVRATVARFWQMLDSVPDDMPHVMPMTAAVAPRFADRYPEAAIIFDNLHSMHDVVSDILANPSVPRNRKRAEILLAARRFRDDTSYVMSVDAWRAMAGHMGIENMGGPAVGFLPELPTPTVTYGAVMTHDDRTGAMTGFRYGSAVGGAHAAHGAAADTARAVDEHAAHGRQPAARPADAHAAHGQPPSRDTAAMPAMHDMPDMPDTGAMRMAHDTGAMHEMHMRMMADPVIRQRIMADTAMHRMMMQMMQDMPPEHRREMERMMHAPAAAKAKPPAARSSAAKAAPPKARSSATKTKTAATKTKSAPTKTKSTPTKTADPHAGHRPPQ